MDLALGLVILAVLGYVYFLPSVVAFRREHFNKGAIFVLNLCLGWTLLGWVVALVWANTSNVKPADPEPDWMKPKDLPANGPLLTNPSAPAAPEKICPFCAETIKAAAIVCKHCGRDMPSAGASQAT